MCFSIKKRTGLKLSKLVQFSRFDASNIHAYALEMIRVYQIPVQAENLTGFATFYAVEVEPHYGPGSLNENYTF